MLSQPFALAVFSGDAGGSIIIKNIGASVERTGVGVYTITTSAVDVTEAAVSVTVTGAAARIANLATTSDTVRTLSVFDAAGAASEDFTAIVQINRVLGGGVG